MKPAVSIVYGLEKSNGFIRDRTRLVTSFVQPLLWLIIFGAAFAARFVLPADLNYQQVLLPGIIGQTLLFTAMFMGINVIWDKEFGFMKETLVAPVSRFTIFLGKMVGDSTDAFMQGIIVFAIGLAIRYPNKPNNHFVRTACNAACHVWLGKHWINDCKLHGQL